MSEKTHVEMLLSLEEDWFAMFLRYAMYLVGLVQLGCIFASIFLSGSDKPEEITSKIRESQSDENLNASKRLHHRTRKQEKKKRR